jgi:very-short-patch-repair endonuclease
MRHDDEIRALASSQHSVIASWQARQLGVTGTELNRLRSSRRWEPVGTRCLRLLGSVDTDGQHAMVAVLDAGPMGVLSHRSAAAWWGIPGYRLRPLHVSQQDERSGPMVSTARLHRLVTIPEKWVTTLDAIPIVRPELVVYQLCGSVHPGKAERALDAAWSMRLLSGASTRAVLMELAKSGRNGTTVLRQLLDDRGDDYVPPASGLESRFQSIIREVGITTMRRQVDSGGEHWIGRVDFSDSELPVIVEVQSERHHTALVDVRDDEARVAALEDAGFTVVPVWDVDVWHRPTVVIAAVHEGRATARRNRAA